MPPSQVQDTIRRASEDPGIHGIMVYYPCLGQPYDDNLRDSMPATKDVEGLCSRHKTTLHHCGEQELDGMQYMVPAATRSMAAGEEMGEGGLAPCTPLAIREVLRQLGVSGRGRGGVAGEGGGGILQGLRVTIVNRSEVVGRPLAAVRRRRMTFTCLSAVDSHPSTSSSFNLPLNSLSFLVMGPHALVFSA